MMKKLFIILLIASFNSVVHASTYYVSPTGNDASPGTINNPFLTIGKLNAVLVAGDIAYIRGGTYRTTAGNSSTVFFQILNLNGTLLNPIKIWAYPGETPVFNLDNVTPTYTSPYAMAMSNCTYVHLKGFTIKNLKQPGVTGFSRGFVLFNSPYCTIEFFNVFNIGGSGIQIDHSNNCYFLNCDSHHCGDGLPGTTSGQWNGGDAYDCTGGDPSTDIVFEGCRAWICGDDGWDFFDWAGSKVTLKNCWSFWASIKPWGINGTQPDEAGMTAADPALWENNNNWRTSTSTGEGFKLGGHSAAGPAGAPTTLKKYLQNCVSFENSGTGFAANMQSQYSHKMQMVNCIAFKNGNDGFAFGTGRSVGIAMIFKNNWAWNNNKLNSGADWVYDGLPTNISNNYWGTVFNGINYGNLNPSISTNTADFLSTSSIGVTGARQPDGKLPYLDFLRLFPASDLIDKGIDVGLPFIGTAPDLGAFEYFSTPTINAGPDRIITLPENSVAITPVLTGTFFSFQWIKLSGGAATILSPTAANTTISNLVSGIYTFSLTGVGIDGITLSDTIQVTVNPAVNQPPVANAGPDQNITLPTNTIILNGSGTDPDGTITSYLWRKISGPASGTVTNPSLASTTVTGMVQGIYQLELTVTDNSGAADTDTMQVTVNPAVNLPPVANAGPDQNITLPTNSVILNGSGTDPDGTIASYSWRKLAGPAGGTITNSSSASTTVTGLVQGIYQLELRVTDNSGAADADTIQVTVNPVLNLAPIAHAGADSIIYLPDNTAILSGSGTDADGTIVGYSWRILSGGSYLLTNQDQPIAGLGNLQQGVYEFELTVTDNLGATGKDTLKISVVNQGGRSSPGNELIILNNPVSDLIQIKINSDDINKQAVISCFDSKGALLLRKEIIITQHTQVEELNGSKLPAGEYFFKVNIDQGIALRAKAIKRS